MWGWEGRRRFRGREAKKENTQGGDGEEESGVSHSRPGDPAVAHSTQNLFVGCVSFLYGVSHQSHTKSSSGL